jgi:hypothetical protein
MGLKKVNLSLCLGKYIVLRHEVSDKLQVPAALPPGKEPLAPIEQEAGWP